MPLFSLVTITKDNLGGLRATAQSLPPPNPDLYDWIVIDGASQDGTQAFLNTTHAHWISEPDGGIYDAMNKGIGRTRGEYLLFLNAGDRLHSADTLTKIENAIGPSRPDFIYGDSLEAGRYKPARPHSKLAKGMFTHHQAMLYRREALGNLRYDTSYKIAADYDFTAHFLYLRHPPTCSEDPFISPRKRRNGSSAFAEDDGMIKKLTLPICIFEPGGVSQQNATIGRREQFEIRKKLGLCSPIQNHLITARQALATSLRHISPALFWRFQPSCNTPRG